MFSILLKSNRHFVLLITFSIGVCSLNGCSTLSALGVPTLSNPNELIRPAKQISGAVGYAANAPKELSKSVLDYYLVEPSDVLYIEPAKFDSPVRLTGDQTVQPDGTVELGRFGRPVVVQKTIQQIQTEIQSLIESVEPKAGPISVRLVNWESKQFYVLGEVNSPGAFRIDGNETVLDAILEAGGLTDKGNRHRIILSRPTGEGSCRNILPICYNQIVQLGDSSTNYQIAPGDRVFVASVTLIDDIKDTLFPFANDRCPKCSAKPEGCESFPHCVQQYQQ